MTFRTTQSKISRQQAGFEPRSILETQSWLSAAGDFLVVSRGQGRACPHSKRDGGPDRVVGGAQSCAVRLALNQTGYGERLDVLMHPLVVATDRSGERGDARGRCVVDVAQQFQPAWRQCARQRLEAVEREMTFLHDLAALRSAPRISETRAHVVQSVVDVDLEFAHVCSPLAALTAWRKSATRASTVQKV